MAVAMTANGILREVVLVPRLGATAAGVVSAAVGVAILLTISGAFLLRVPLTRRDATSIAVVWLVLTVGFEFLIGRSVDRKSWQELLANYNLLAGRLWPLVLAALVASPFLWRWWQQRHSPSGGERDPSPH